MHTNVCRACFLALDYYTIKNKSLLKKYWCTSVRLVLGPRLQVAPSTGGLFSTVPRYKSCVVCVLVEPRTAEAAGQQCHLQEPQDWNR